MFSSVALVSDWQPIASRSSVLLKVIPKPSPTDEQTVAKRDLVTSGYSDHHQEKVSSWSRDAVENYGDHCSTKNTLTCECQLPTREPELFPGGVRILGNTDSCLGFQ